MIETTEKLNQSGKAEMQVKNNNFDGEKVVTGSTQMAPDLIDSHHQSFEKTATIEYTEENQNFIKGYN